MVSYACAVLLAAWAGAVAIAHAATPVARPASGDCVDPAVVQARSSLFPSQFQIVGQSQAVGQDAVQVRGVSPVGVWR